MHYYAGADTDLGSAFGAAFGTQPASGSSSYSYGQAGSQLGGAIGGAIGGQQGGQWGSAIGETLADTAQGAADGGWQGALGGLVEGLATKVAPAAIQAATSHGAPPSQAPPPAPADVLPKAAASRPLHPAKPLPKGKYVPAHHVAMAAHNAAQGGATLSEILAFVKQISQQQSQQAAATAPANAPASTVTSGFYADLDDRLGISTDMDTRSAQHYLNLLGAARLTEDGILGKHTSRALRDFQDHQGLAETGALDPETRAALAYLVAAASSDWRAKELAATTPEILASLPGAVTYSPYPMPPLQPRQGAPYAPAPAMTSLPATPKSPASPGALPPDLAAAIDYFGALARTPPTPLQGGHLTGLQSTTWYDPWWFWTSP